MDTNEKPKPASFLQIIGDMFLMIFCIFAGLFLVVGLLDEHLRTAHEARFSNYLNHDAVLVFGTLVPALAVTAYRLFMWTRRKVQRKKPP